MGALSINPQDLKLSTISTTTLHPSCSTPKRSMFLSNIDQVLNFSVETIHFFNRDPEITFDAIVDTLRSALERLLEPYDLLAGRLRFNDEGRMEIECNGEGVRFVVAKSELDMKELGELEFPNPVFRQLATTVEVAAGGDGELCTFQVTCFKCGGFAMGISTDHSVFDGISFQIFLKNLAALAFNKPLAVQPYTDRRLLAARSPPRVEFPHPELLKLELLKPNSSMISDTSCVLEFKLFYLNIDDIYNLKEKAKINNMDGPVDPYLVTSFNVVIAHLWRCKALATNESDDGNKASTVLYAVDVRKKINPPLPSSYTGNAVLSAYATTTCYELENGPFAKIVGMVREGAKRINDQYIRSVIDWGQLNKGFPYGDVFISSWWKLGFSEVEYPWGTPVYSCPVAHPRRDIILLFPNIKGAEKGVNVLIALPKGDMEKFQSFFYKFLE